MLFFGTNDNVFGVLQSDDADEGAEVKDGAEKAEDYGVFTHNAICG